LLDNDRPENVMALKDLLVCVDPTEDSLARMRLAADLASRHGSRLTALHAREWSEAQQHEQSGRDGPRDGKADG
jgi:K+-sensing histidine kinase KdpD